MIQERPPFFLDLGNEYFPLVDQRNHAMTGRRVQFRENIFIVKRYIFFSC